MVGLNINALIMERKLFYADAFPHHETCGCKLCKAEEEKTFELEPVEESSGEASDTITVVEANIQAK